MLTNKNRREWKEKTSIDGRCTVRERERYIEKERRRERERERKIYRERKRERERERERVLKSDANLKLLKRFC